MAEFIHLSATATTPAKYLNLENFVAFEVIGNPVDSDFRINAFDLTDTIGSSWVFLEAHARELFAHLELRAKSLALIELEAER
ncbi:MAG: hypothetical protein HC910_21585 [Spirulinaceae cyanobacterium SM2_1_0]|nr:hypothetical protein [Spirulinaceae cyanobacterium SM2_1_0]